jgi:hypothetical protein
MNPNWSKLASLFRTLVILGASSFVGAIVLPLATDGTLPITWAAWRPILAVGASAAVVAEFLWIRAHLQAAAQAIGVVANDANTPPAIRAALMKVTLSAMTVLGFSVLLACHETPQAIAAQNLDLTDYACAVAEGQPAGQPYVDLVCTLLTGEAQLVSVIVGATSSADGGVQAAVAQVPMDQIRIRMPTGQVQDFLAKHQTPAKK